MSRLTLNVQPSSGSFEAQVMVYSTMWVPLPGSREHWPMVVTDADLAIPVIEREGRPAVRLDPGQHLLKGEFQWDSVPQRIAIPGQYGLLRLTINGDEVPAAKWDASGDLWLQRQSEEETGADQLFAQV
jgi:hypothetical protein